MRTVSTPIKTLLPKISEQKVYIRKCLKVAYSYSSFQHLRNYGITPKNFIFEQFSSYSLYQGLLHGLLKCLIMIIYIIMNNNSLYLQMI